MYKFILILITSFCFNSVLFAQSDNQIKFPIILNDQNTTVNFEVDSTWHMVHGKTSQIKGELFLEKPEQISSLKGQIVIPVVSFNTDNSSRDKKLLLVMAASQFPDVQLEVINTKNLCEPNQVAQGELGNSCLGEVEAQLQIRDVNQKINFPIKLEKNANGVFVSGHFILNWKDFNVEDPSILIAKVKAEAKVSFELKLN